MSPADYRTPRFYPVVLALVLRIVFAGVTIQLLSIPGLLLVGGLLLFWVAWRMWQDISHHKPIMVGDAEAGEHAAEAIASGGNIRSAYILVMLPAASA